MMHTIEYERSISEIFDEDPSSNNINSENAEEIEFQSITINRTPNDSLITDHCIANQTNTIA